MNEASSSTDNDGLSVLLCTDYLPQSGGGVEAVVETLAKRLADCGVSVAVFALRRRGKHPTDLAAHEGVAVYTARALDLTSVLGLQSRISPVAPFRLARLLRTLQPDVVHLHNRFFFTSLIGALRWYDAPVVFTAHTGSIGDIDGISGRVARTYDRTVGGFVARRNDQLIAVSDTVADHVRDLGADPVRMISNGVDTARFHPPESRAADEKPQVLFVGRLVHNKGPQTFVDSLPTVFERIPDAEAAVVGPGPMCEELERRCDELGIADRVTFHGYVDDVPEMMHAADVFCLPSFSEGLPLTLLEAMASQLPPVVSAVGGVPDVIRDGETGLLVSPGDTEAVGSAVAKLLESPTRRREIGERARQYVIKEHSWDARISEIIEVYKDVACDARQN